VEVADEAAGRLRPPRLARLLLAVATGVLVAFTHLGVDIRSSHERWDGAGYPDAVGHEAIPLAARIIAVCDAFTAMVEGRPYRESIRVEEAVAELRRCAGTQFDPFVVAAFPTALAEVQARDGLVEAAA
jgi:HD-GYP domain-containing protein (c-di-GMP phosphodiesterase class II)